MKDKASRRCRWCRREIESGATICDRCGHDQSWLGRVPSVAALVSILAVGLTFYQACEARRERLAASEATGIAEAAATRSKSALSQSRKITADFLILQGEQLLLSISQSELWTVYLRVRRDFSRCEKACPPEIADCGCEDEFSRSLGKAGKPFLTMAESYQDAVAKAEDSEALRQRVCVELEDTTIETARAAFEILFGDWCRSVDRLGP